MGVRILSFMAAIAPTPMTRPATIKRAERVTDPVKCSATSRPGMIREKNDAASMTPAANPRKASWARIDIDQLNSIGTAPTAVMEPAAKLPARPKRTI